MPAVGHERLRIVENSGAPVARIMESLRNAENREGPVIHDEKNDDSRRGGAALAWFTSYSHRVKGRQWMNDTRGDCEPHTTLPPGIDAPGPPPSKRRATPAPLPTDIERDIHRLAERVGGLSRLQELIGELRVNDKRGACGATTHDSQAV